jgi:hypothetical protein
MGFRFLDLGGRRVIAVLAPQNHPQRQDLDKSLRPPPARPDAQERPARPERFRKPLTLRLLALYRCAAASLEIPNAPDNSLKILI